MWLLLVRHFVSIRTNAKVDLIQTNQVKLGGILGIRALLCLANNLECDESRPYAAILCSKSVPIKFG